jgi:uncharacterized membrane protein
MLIPPERSVITVDKIGVSVNERRIRQAFLLSILLKGAHAVIECVGGIALALVGTNTIAHFVNQLTQDELIEDPEDILATHLVGWSQSFSVESKHFYAFYLLSHGMVKLLLVVGLLRGRLWSYPASLVVFSLFIVYQLYRFSYTHAVGLIALTMLDIVVMFLVWHEYGVVRRHLQAK